MDEWCDVALDVDDEALDERHGFGVPGQIGPSTPAGTGGTTGTGGTGRPRGPGEPTGPQGVIVLDEELRALLRENRLSLWRGAPERVTSADGVSGLDLAMRVVAHPHPDCRFRWVRCRADFQDVRGATVRDLSPRDEIATTPVKLTTTRTLGLTFEIAAVPLAPEAARSRVLEQDVYLPKVTTSGPRFRYAHWDFSAVGEQPLHVDRELRVLLALPADVTAMPVTFTLRASVAVAGLPGQVPLFGRRTVEFRVHQHLL